MMSMKQLKGNALVVDDDENIREILVDCLEELGLIVEEASSGLVALEKVNLKKYDYICTDMTMPGMSGTMFIEKSKKLKNGNTKYFIISGYSECHNKDTGERLYNGYIEKPFSEESLYEVFSNNEDEKISA
jgi:CheY-like chemotaxis protein